MTHGDLVKLLLLAVSPRGLAWSNPTGAIKVDGRFLRYGFVGSSDILMCQRDKGGRMVGIEAKVGDDPWRKDQKKFARGLEAANGLYILARSNDGIGDDAIALTLAALDG